MISFIEYILKKLKAKHGRDQQQQQQEQTQPQQNKEAPSSLRKNHYRRGLLGLGLTNEGVKKHRT